MSAPLDSTTLRIRAILDDEARRVYLGEEPGVVLRCFECNRDLAPGEGFSGVRPEGGRGYVCPECNLREEPDGS